MTSFPTAPSPGFSATTSRAFPIDKDDILLWCAASGTGFLGSSYSHRPSLANSVSLHLGDVEQQSGYSVKCVAIGPRFAGGFRVLGQYQFAELPCPPTPAPVSDRPFGFPDADRPTFSRSLSPPPFLMIFGSFLRVACPISLAPGRVYHLWIQFDRDNGTAVSGMWKML